MRVALKHLYHPTDINLFSVRNKNALGGTFCCCQSKFTKGFWLIIYTEPVKLFLACQTKQEAHLYLTG